MTIAHGLTLSFRLEMLRKEHDLEDDALKIALYDDTASLDEDTAAYSTTGEIVGTGYTAGGQAISGLVLSADGSSIIGDFDNPQWNATTFTARAALIYNTTNANKAVGVIDFGENISTVNEIFRIDLPAATAAQALIRFP